MALACFPVTDIEVLIIVVALAPAFAQTLSPCSVVLVIRALFLVGAVEHSLPIALVIENLSFVEIAVEVGYLGYLTCHLCSEAELACAKAGSACCRSSRVQSLPVLHVALVELPEVVGIVQRPSWVAVIESW